MAADTPPKVMRIRSELTTLAIEAQALGNQLRCQGPAYHAHAKAVRAQAKALATTCRQLAERSLHDSDRLALAAFFPLERAGAIDNDNDDEG